MCLCLCLWSCSVELVGVSEHASGATSGACFATRVTSAVCVVPCAWCMAWYRVALVVEGCRVMPHGVCAFVVGSCVQAPPSPSGSSASSASTATAADDDDNSGRSSSFVSCFCCCFSSPGRGDFATHPTPKVCDCVCGCVCVYAAAVHRVCFPFTVLGCVCVLVTERKLPAAAVASNGSP